MGLYFETGNCDRNWSVIQKLLVGSATSSLLTTTLIIFLTGGIFQIILHSLPPVNVDVDWLHKRFSGTVKVPTPSPVCGILWYISSSSTVNSPTIIDCTCVLSTRISSGVLHLFPWTTLSWGNTNVFHIFAGLWCGYCLDSIRCSRHDDCEGALLRAC